jgi:NAD(P)-dependent dehydrogenase (short-subunit alcohol dehydrogenase family)
MNQPLLNKVALVTGASRGLGLEIAIRMARDGAHLFLSARDAAVLESAAARVASHCTSLQKIRICAFDLAKNADALADRALSEFAAVDILVNNAAIQGPIGAFDSIDAADWKAVFDVNLFAPARLSQRLIPSMKKIGGGKIINLSGGGAASPRPHFSAYGASKCALVRLAETLAEELRNDRIDVNAVAPGPMNTRMLDELLAAGPECAPREYEAAVKRSREGGTSPDRAAALVAWLASPASDGITGKLLSAVWDDWERLGERREQLRGSDLYTLRRVTESK